MSKASFHNLLLVFNILGVLSIKDSKNSVTHSKFVATINILRMEFVLYILLCVVLKF